MLPSFVYNMHQYTKSARLIAVLKNISIPSHYMQVLSEHLRASLFAHESDALTYKPEDFVDLI